MSEIMCPSPAAILKKADCLIEASLDDSVILLHLEKSRYFGGDQVVADIWRFIDGGKTIETIARELAVQYDAPLEVIVSDLCEFAKVLFDEGLVTWSDGR